MARKPAKKKRSAKAKAKGAAIAARWSPLRWLWRRLAYGFLAVVGVVLLAIVTFSAVNPPTTHTIWSEKRRLGEIDHQWVGMEEIAPVMARSVVAAEDANFCRHWGIDVAAVKLAIEEGGGRGASTISQQTVKNVFFWQGRSWFRKAGETLLTPLVEIFWSKRRILEVYLNVAEFDEGVFGIDAASYHYFGVPPTDLSPTQAARLAAVLPSPKTRSASRPTSFIQRRSAAIRDGAATIKADGRADCFEQ